MLAQSMASRWNAMAYPDRLDLKDVYLRMCKQRGVKVVISTDSHNALHLPFIRYGVATARRGWLEKSDVINTLPAEQFLAALRPKPALRNQQQRQAMRRKLQQKCDWCGDGIIVRDVEETWNRYSGQPSNEAIKTFANVSFSGGYLCTKNWLANRTLFLKRGSESETSGHGEEIS